MVGRKPEDWRILTPIFSMLSPVIVGALGWFLMTGYNEQKETNRMLFQKMDKYIEIQVSDRSDIEQKYSYLRYQCCSEMRSQ